MFSLQDLLGSPMLSSMAQPSFSPAQQTIGVPCNAQLFNMLMNAQLQHLLASLPCSDKGKDDVNHLDEQRTSTTSTTTTQCSFSIDNLLRPESVEKQTSHSPESDVTTYTLDALEVSDGRTKRERRFSSSRCVCDQCGKSYATTSNLSRHKQTHRPLDSEHAKQCPHCDRVYVSMPALSMHILTHKANHKCGLCGKVFSRLWLLQHKRSSSQRRRSTAMKSDGGSGSAMGHLRSHTGQRPFGCAHCGKNFADRSNLRAHILTHTGEKKYSCKKCGRRFALRSYLNRHTETSCRSDDDA